MPCGGLGTLLEVRADGSVRVTGTTDGSSCQSFSVSVADLTGFKSASPDANGNWVLVFAGGEITGDLARFRRVACGKETKVAIRCDEPGSTCNQSTPVEVRCERDPGCPSVSFTITPGDCVNGRRTVHIGADVVSANDATFVWFFGTDEDNQPGEDSQAGDGAGNMWLPATNANGVRHVEIDHVYEPTGNQPSQVTVTLQTSDGPTTLCIATQTFTLEPCTCGLTVSLEVLDQAGRPVPVNRCLVPGDYAVRVASPTGGNIDYSWSLDGVADETQTGSNYDVSIAAGEQKTVSCFVEQGACDASNAVTIEGCEDCRRFDAQVRVLDSNRREVDADRCLAAGNYTVEATSPTGAGNSFRWLVNDALDANAIGNTVQVALGDDDQQRVVLDASRGGCRDLASVTLTTCVAPPPPPRHEEDESGTGGCGVLYWIGLFLLIIGSVLAFGGGCTLNPVIIGTGIAAAVVGTFLLIMWALFCVQIAGCRALQRLIGFINALIALFAALGIALAIVALILAALGLPPVNAGCIGAAFTVAGYLSVVNLILFWIFLAKPCQWEGDNPFFN